MSGPSPGFQYLYAVTLKESTVFACLKVLAERAVKIAMAMRGAAGLLIAEWRERGRELGFGVAIAQGYATLAQIGFSERGGHIAIGMVCNVGTRLCA